MWTNLKQKISDELSARITKIVNELETRNNTSKIEKTLIEINKKFSAHISEVNDNSTAEISKLRMKSIPTSLRRSLKLRMKLTIKPRMNSLHMVLKSQRTFHTTLRN